MRRGVIDIGTNSVKLLIADLRGDEISPHLETSRQTRLGRGLYSGGKLQAEPIQATVAAVNELLALAKANDCSDTRIIATSAVRDSSNPAELLDALGQAVDVLSGDNEARLVFAGVMGCPRLAKSPTLMAVMLKNSCNCCTSFWARDMVDPTLCWLWNDSGSVWR